MSLEQFAAEFLTILQLRRSLGDLPAEERREAEREIVRRQAELKGQPRYWDFVFELVPRG